MHFTKAIVRTPCENLTKGLRSHDLGKPDYRLALLQHQAYIDALVKCGLEVSILSADNAYPDSTFVEDTALLTEEFAIITRPGADSRKGETNSIEEVVAGFFSSVSHISEPGTLEAGDVMMAGDRYFIGLSERTNPEGAAQLKQLLEQHGMSASIVEIPDILHLKSGVSYLENNTLLAIDMLNTHPAFSHMDIIPVPVQEAYAANSLWINDTILVPDHYPVTLHNIREAGYQTIVLDMSEFRKLDGGLSCLSLRF